MDIDAVREWGEFILIILGAAAGFYKFIYQELKEKKNLSKRPATLDISGMLEEVGRKGSMAIVRARVHAVNHSEVKVYAPAFWFNVRGYRISVGERADKVWTEQVQSSVDQYYFEESKSLSRYSRPVATDVIATWRFLQLETWYEPSDETTNEEIIYVPVDRYDTIQLKVEINLTKSIDALAPTEWIVGADGSLAPNLMFKRPGYENDSSLVEPFDSVSNPEHKDWEMKQGLSYNWSVTTLPILASRDAASAVGEKAVLAE